MNTLSDEINIKNEATADIAAIEAVTIAAFLHASHTSHTEQVIVEASRPKGIVSHSRTWRTGLRQQVRSTLGESSIEETRSHGEAGLG